MERMTSGSTTGNDHVVALLDQYRTGELSDGQRRHVEAHLEVCGDCMAALADLGAFASTVEKGYEAERALTAESEPDWARVRHEIIARTSAKRARWRRGWLAHHVPQTAAAVVAVLAVVIVVQQGVRGPEDVSRALRSAESSDRAEVDGPDTGPPASGPRSSEVDAVGALESETENLEPNTARQGQEEAFDEADRADDLRENQIAVDREIPAVGEIEHAAEPKRGVFRDQVGQAKPDAATPPPPDEEEALKDGYYRQKPAAGEDGKVAEGEPAAVADKLEAQIDVDAEAKPLSRFEVRARYAITKSDTLAANAALEFWHDSLAAGADLEPADRDRAQALADSLASLLARRP